jgi:hypothetical protein
MPVVCPTGKFSTSFGVRASTDCLDCFEGYYCGGTTTRTICVGGIVCPAKSTDVSKKA